jgi:hypothetical protein
MAAWVFRSQEMAADAAGLPPAGSQPAMYWNENNASRWTNAVAAFGTRLIAPPYASSRTDARAGAAARASIARRSVSMPALESGVVT